MLVVPSVEVAKGVPHPFWLTFHMGKLIVGGLVAVMRKLASTLLLERKATYVPWLVRYVVAAWMIPKGLFETCDEDSAALIPPRLLRLSRYALPSLPSATTRLDGVAPGTSTSNGPEPPISLPP
jgi:hypothetical protein